MSEETKTMWAAELSYGKANLARMKIIKETDKTIVVESYVNIMGDQYSINTVSNWSNGRNSKHKFELFQDERSAMEWLIDQARYYLSKLESKIEDGKAELQRLEQRLEGGD